MQSGSVVPATKFVDAVTAMAPTAGRARIVDKQTVFERALWVVDHEGLAALTIRRLADELGVSIGTIQSVAGRKEEILRGLVECALAPTEVVAGHGQDPQRDLVDLLTAVHEALMVHPVVAQLAAMQRLSGPVTLHVQEKMLELLRATGLSESRVVTRYAMVASYVTGFTLLRISRDQYEAEAGEPQLDAMLRQLPADQFPQLRAFSERLTTQTSTKRFREGLRELLRGT